MRRFWIFGHSNEVQKEVDQKYIPDPELESNELSLGVPESTTGLTDENCKIPISNNSSILQESTSVYYGVSLPSGNSCNEEDEDKPLVFTDKTEALRAMKKYKGARFKAFLKEEEAVSFASQSVEQICPTPKCTTSPFSFPVVEQDKNQGVVGEKSSPFRGPKSQDMVKLRKAIETADIDYCKETIWSNPRYLISSGDTPAIMQEGFRYNALHVAAKFKQPELCQLILDTIQDPKFMELLYIDDSETVRSQRLNFITDLYLNMPDKGLCETPLHFACKFGCLGVVQILVSHPTCDKRRKNKYGLEAREIICERCPSSSAEYKQQIQNVFEDQYFVPVLRSNDNSAQPLIGEPCSPKSLKISSGLIQSNSPRDPTLSVMAVAGPMSPKQAKAFYKSWKTPPRFSKENQEYHLVNKTRLCDTEKGLERIGRYLAQHMKTSWKEYWPSLNAWCDLSTYEGLQVLETHLKKLYYEMNSKEESIDCEDQNTPEKNPESSDLKCVSSEGSPEFHSTPTNMSIMNRSNSSSGGISALCQGLQKFHMYDSDDGLVTSPDMPNVFNSQGDTSKQENEISSYLSDSSFEYSTVADSLPSNNQILCDLTKFENMNGCAENANKLESYHATDEINKEPDMLSVKFQFNDKEQRQLKQESDLKVKTTIDDDVCCDKTPIIIEKSTSVNKDLLTIKKNSMSTSECKNDLPRIKKNPSIANNIRKSNTLRLAIKNVVQSVMEMFLDLTKESASVVQGLTVHLLVSEDVLPKVQSLLELKLENELEWKCVHSYVANEIFEELQTLFIQNERDLVFRYLTLYIESHFSVGSSGDETENNRKSSRMGNSSSAFINKVKWQHLRCVLQYLCELLSNNEDAETLLKPCNCNWRNEQNEKEVCSSRMQSIAHKEFEEHHPLLCKLENISDIAPKTLTLLNTNSQNAESCEDEFLTPPSSPPLDDWMSNSSLDEPVTPEEGLEVYVEGENPSKADADILKVVEDVQVDPVLYPHICRWKHLVSSKGNNIVESWPSPAVRKYRQHKAEISKIQMYPVSPLTSRREIGSSISSLTIGKHYLQDHVLKEAQNLYKKFMKCDEVDG